ncbi:MAG: hypothetical protein OEV40_05375 [Acidimicrobiia bacterium]|nr:hypothetical protein [Acidimicrobiia bacterium]
MANRNDAMSQQRAGAAPAASNRGSGAGTTVSRRQFVLAGGAIILAACTGDGSGPVAQPFPSSGSGPTTADETTSSAVVASNGADRGASSFDALTAAQFDSIPTCLLLPEMTTGPFPLDEQFERADITEGYPGHPTRLGLRVVDGNCGPVAGASVEVWHTDASGDYSAFVDNGGGKDEGLGTTFLRGTQRANEAGIVEFHTIYPGWYPGRAVHVHLRVRVDGAPVLTSQLFFPDDVTSTVFTSEPYAEFGPPDTTNGTDRLAGDVEVSRVMLTTMETDTVGGRGTLALANLGVGTRS